MSLLQNVFRAVASPAVVQNMGWLLVHSLWQCMLVAFLAMCLAKMMRRQSSSAQYGMLTIAMSLMVISPVATMLAFPQTEVLIPASGERVKSVSLELVEDLQQVEGDNGDAIPLVPPPTDARGAIAAIKDERPVNEPGPVSITTSYSSWIKVTLSPWLSTIVALWCCGVLLFSIRPIWGCMMVRRLLRVGTSPVAAHVQQALRLVCEKMQVRQRVEVLASSLVGSPIVVGCFRSVILVPASFVSSLPISQLEAILAHELAHVRRYDYLVNLMQLLVETLFFYHPAVWWLSGRIRVERENCCDDLVVAVLGNKGEYGRALLAVEEFRSAATTSLALSAKGGSLLARVKRLFAGASHDTPRSATGVGLVGLLLIVAAAATLWTYASAQDNSDKPNASEVVAKIPGGLTARLLGVGYHPSADKPWWNANGELLKEPLRPEGAARMFEGASQQAKCREFVFEIEGLGKDCAVRSDFGGRGSGMTSSLSDGMWRGYCATGPFDDPATTIRLGIANEPYGPTLVINSDGLTVTRDGIPPSLRLMYDQFQSRGIVQEDGWRLAADSLDKLSEKADWKLVAVDTQGKSQRYTSMSGGEGKVSFGFGIPQQNIDHFEFQLRPYRHWVTLENVSLQPGKKTAVKISVESHPSDESALSGVFDPLPLWQTKLSADDSSPELSRVSAVVVTSDRVLSVGKDFDLRTGRELEKPFARLPRKDQFDISLDPVLRRKSSDRQFAVEVSLRMAGVTTLLGPSYDLRVLRLSDFSQIGKTITLPDIFDPHACDVDVEDGGKFVLLGDRESVRVYRTETGQVEATLPQRITRVDAVAFCPDRKWIVVSDQNELHFWPWRDGTPVKTIQAGHKIDSLIFTADGRHLAEGPDTREEIQIRDMRTWDVIASLKDGAGSPLMVSSIDITRDGRYLVAHNEVSVDQTKLTIPHRIHVWDLRTRVPVFQIATGEWVRRVAFSDDGRLIVGEFSGAAHGALLAAWRLPDEVINGKAETNAADVKVMSATRAGRWHITEGCELEITQKLVHATDIMTSGVLRLKGADGDSRHVPLSIAVDHFANRERWKAVWEKGKPVLWYAKGLGDGPGRKLPPGAKIKIEELQRIDFSNPNCIEHRSYTGWAAAQLPSVELRTALEETFEIKADGQEQHRYYESAVVGASDKSVEHLYVWIGENGKIEVQDLAWVPNTGESREIKCELKTLPETLALVLKKFRRKAGSNVPIYAYISTRPDLKPEDLKSVLNACRQNGLQTPELPLAAPPENFKSGLNRWRRAWRDFYAAQPASDLHFIRNASVDLIGIGVTDEAAKQFINNSVPDKRLKLIEGIFASNAFERLHVQQRDENDAFHSRQQTLPPRILRGPAAKLRADEYQLKAGKPVGGLTLAIALRSATNHFRVGERIPLDVLLFNASGEPRTHDFSFDFIGNPPRVVDEIGNEVSIEKLDLTSLIPFYRETLRPGDYFLYPHIGLGLGENPTPGENWHPHTPPLKPGKYRLMQQWKNLTSGEIEFEIIAAGAAIKAVEANADTKDKTAWLRFCPGTQVIEHTDAKFVSGVVVDEEGRPISGCSVEHPGLTGPKTDEHGQFQYKQSVPHRTVLRAYHPEFRAWHGAPQLGDVLRIVLQKKPKVEVVDGTREMTVRVIDSRTAEPVPDVKVAASRYEGPQNGTVAATAVTNQDGTVVMRGLDFIQHRLSLSADRPVSYIGNLAHPGADQHDVVMLVDRACVLVLRAVDSKTGKGIAGVVFERENAVGERWQQSIDPDILGGRDVQQNAATDADGYFRCLVSSYPWNYMVAKYPKGYGSIVPIAGAQEVEIPTIVGGIVEYTFRLVRTNDAVSTEAPGKDEEATGELVKLRNMGWRIDVPASAVVQSDDRQTIIESSDGELTIPGDGVPELRKVKARSVRLILPRGDATAARLELQGDVMLFTPRAVLRSDKAFIEVGKKRYELEGSSLLMDGDVEVRAQRLTFTDDALTAEGEVTLIQGLAAGPVIQFKAASISVDLQRHLMQWKGLNSDETGIGPFPELGLHRDQADVARTKLAWKARRADSIDTQSKETFEILGDDSVQMSLPSPNGSAPILKFKINEATSLDSIRLELLPDTRSKDRRLGRMPGRTLKLFEVKPSVNSADGSTHSVNWDKWFVSAKQGRHRSLHTD